MRIYGSEFERTEPVKTLKKEPEVLEEKELVQEEKEKPEISDAMRQRLRRELQAQGADPNYSAGPIKGNPILIVSAVVAILVLLGGKGFFF